MLATAAGPLARQTDKQKHIAAFTELFGRSINEQGCTYVAVTGYSSYLLRNPIKS